jgi:hypothetical protein
MSRAFEAPAVIDAFADQERMLTSASVKGAGD